LKSSGKINAEKKADELITLINKLYKKTKLNNPEEKSLVAYINKDNIDAIIELITEYPFADSKLKILEMLTEKEICNSSVNNLYGITLADAGFTDKAIEVLSENFESDKQNPTIVFYLISLLIKKSEFNKISDLLAFAAENFSHIPEVKSRLQIISDKLSFLLKK